MAEWPPLRPERAATYQPRASPPQASAALGNRTYDSRGIGTFCQETLYKTADTNKRKQFYEKYLRDHGSVYAVGIMNQLFEDLETIEAHEEGSVSWPLTRFSTQPRELLVELFDKPVDVKSSDRPDCEVVSESRKADLIRTLTLDISNKSGDVIRQMFLKSAQDDYLATACLLCLAHRGYRDFLIEQLENINLAETTTNRSYFKYILAISTSKENVVRDKLLDIVKTTKNGAYFTAALLGVKQLDDALVLELAEKIIDGFSEDTNQGREIMRMLGLRYPAKAKRIYKRFLGTGSARRAETMCIVLRGNPWSKGILAPLLDDKRELEGFTCPVRVCDRAAEAISHTTDIFTFDSEWSVKRKDEAIARIKQSCKQAPE